MDRFLTSTASSIPETPIFMYFFLRIHHYDGGFVAGALAGSSAPKLALAPFPLSIILEGAGFAGVAWRRADCVPVIARRRGSSSISSAGSTIMVFSGERTMAREALQDLALQYTSFFIISRIPFVEYFQPEVSFVFATIYIKLFSVPASTTKHV